jgi:KipI family sensor histidine kinase inhibitor
MMPMKREWLGDRALVLYFEQEIRDDVRLQVMKITRAFEKKALPFQNALIPAYASLTIMFTKSLKSADQKKILSLVEKSSWEKNSTKQAPGALIEIPVFYGGEVGPDLLEVAKLHQMSPEELIRVHAEPIYEVNQIGFTPGFPYLSGLPEKLRTPRLSTPRSLVHAGSVGIGDAQTGVYTVDGPGGWRIIGKTPLTLFDPFRKKPALLKAGMRVKFIPQKGRS